MLEWFDDVLRRVDQWSVDVLNEEEVRKAKESPRRITREVKPSPSVAPLINPRANDESATPTKTGPTDSPKPLKKSGTNILSTSSSGQPSLSSSQSLKLERKEFSSGASSSSVYRDRPELLTPMESKWQKFLHTHNISMIEPHSAETHQLVLKSMYCDFYYFFSLLIMTSWYSSWSARAVLAALHGRVQSRTEERGRLRGNRKRIETEQENQEKK